jgi:hypothetical protein
MPFVGESLLGYLKRHAAVIGMPTVAAFIQQFDLPADVRSVPAADISVLVAAFGDAGAGLEAMQYRRNEKRMLVRGHLLSRHYLDTFSMRWCPGCLNEGQYHREIWNLAFMKVCAIHQVKLLQNCPNCSSRAQWSRPGLDSCSCGAGFAAMEAKGCSELAARCADFLGRVFDATLEDCECPAILKSMPLEEAVDFISLLGRMACEAKGLLPGKGRPMTWQHADELIGLGYEVALDWPRSFVAILDSLSDGYGDQASNLKDVFGSCYAPMRRAPTESYGTTIRSVLTPYCFRRFGISVDDYRPEDTDTRRSSLEDARIALGASPNGFRKIKKQFSLQRKGRQKFVAGNELEVVRAAQSEICNGKTMGQLLGLHVKKQIKEVLDSGIFATGVAGSDKRARFASRTKVEAFLMELEKACESAGKAANSGPLVTWPQLRRMASQRKVTLPLLIQLLADGKLNPTSSKMSAGLPGLLFGRNSALAALGNSPH